MVTIMCFHGNPNLKDFRMDTTGYSGGIAEKEKFRKYCDICLEPLTGKGYSGDNYGRA